MDLMIEDILCNVKEYLQNLSDNDALFALKGHTHTKSEVTDFTHDNTSHSEEYATKTYTDTQLGTKVGKNEQIAIDKITDLRSTLNEKSSVSFTRSLDNGTKIGKITINGRSTDIFCETNTDTIYSHPATHDTNMIIDPNRHVNIGSEVNATQSTINTQIDTKINNKVDKVIGKGLSTNDYTTAEQNKLNNIETEANKYVHPSYDSVNENIYKITTENGHIKTATAITKSDITNLGIPENDTTYNNATTTEAGLMSTDDKEKIDYLSPYKLCISNSSDPNVVVTNESTITIPNHSHIYTRVIKPDKTFVSGEMVHFMINGIVYKKTLDPNNNNFADLQINLGSGNRYEIVCIYRKDGFVEAFDKKIIIVE